MLLATILHLIFISMQSVRLGLMSVRFLR